MAKNIYGFIVDEALFKWSADALIGRTIDQGVGYATDNVLEFFNDVVIVRDPRSTRKRNYLTNNDTFRGTLGFLVDHQPPNSDGVSGSTDEDATPADVFVHDGLAAGELNKIFNIIEDCLYNRSTTTSQLVTSMLNMLFSSNSDYNGYVVGSLEMSSSSVGDESFVGGDINAYTTNGAAIPNTDLQLPYWFKFSFNSSTLGVLNFRLWLHRDTFLANYPYSTVVDVVLPYEAAILTDPDNLPRTNLETLINSSNFINGLYSDNYREHEASGAKVFPTPYLPDTYTDPGLSMPFGVVYKGIEPSSDLCKKAIRNKLRESGIEDSMWEVVFPELFVASKFYLIPIWDNTFSSAGTLTEHGITRWSTMFSKLQAIFPTYGSALLNEKLEFILNDATNLLIAVIPGVGNDSSKFLGRIHRTYVPVDATDAIWERQESATRTFNRRLGYAIADSIRGSITHTEITEEMVNLGTEENPVNRKFLYFSWNHVDYYVLDQSSWIELA